MESKKTSVDLVALLEDIRTDVKELEAEIQRDVRLCVNQLNDNTQRLTALLTAFYAKKQPVCLDAASHGLSNLLETQGHVKELQAKVRSITTMTSNMAAQGYDGTSPARPQRQRVTPAGRMPRNDVDVNGDTVGDDIGASEVEGDAFTGTGDLQSSTLPGGPLPLIHDDDDQEEEEGEEQEEDGEVEEEADGGDLDDMQEDNTRVRLDYGRGSGAGAGAAATGGSSSSSSVGGVGVGAGAGAGGGGGLFDDALADAAKLRRPPQEGPSGRSSKQPRSSTNGAVTSAAGDSPSIF